MSSWEECDKCQRTSEFEALCADWNGYRGAPGRKTTHTYR